MSAPVPTPSSWVPVVLACDTETTLSTAEEYIPDLVVTSWANDKEVELVHQRDLESKATAQAALEHRSAWAFGPFDWAVYAKKYPHLERVVFEGLEEGRYRDVLMEAKLWDIANGRFKFNRGKGKKQGYSLQAVMYRMLHFSLDKDDDTWRKRYGELIDKPVMEWPDDAQRYARSDGAATMLVVRELESRRKTFQEVHGLDVFEDEFRQNRANWALHLISATGICIDQNQVVKFERGVIEEWERLAVNLHRVGLIRIEREDPLKLARVTKVAKARMERACEDLGIPVPLTPKEEIALDEESCEASGDELLMQYARFTSLGKLRSTYIKPMKAVGGQRYHAAFDGLLDTGRTSCRGILQVALRASTAKGMRECFAAPRGKLLVAGDFGKAELVAWAQIQMALFGSSALGDALRRGLDPHLMIAAQVLQISYEEALARFKAGDPVVAQVREAAKPGNFGFPVGMSAATYVGYAKSSYGVTLPGETLAEQVKFATMIRNNWRKTWDPEAGRYLDYVGQLIPQPRGPDGKLLMKDGKPIRGRGTIVQYKSNRIRGGVSFTEAANGFFQGLTADAAKHAMWKVAWRQYMEPSSAMYRSARTVNFVHDELILEVPIDRAKAVARELEETMISAYAEWCPDVPVVVEARISERWTKG